MNDSAQPDVSVIIVSFNTRDLLRECLNTLYRYCAGVALETIVVDNASRDESAEMVEAEFPDVLLIRSDVNLGFGPANNRGFERARGRYVVLLNSDAFLGESALARAVELMDCHPGVGLAGGLLVGRDGEWQPSARLFPSVLNEFLTLSGLSARYPGSRFFGRVDRTWADFREPAEIDWVPGAFSIVRREVLDRLQGFDERFFLYFEEVDLCRRIRSLGYGIAYWPQIEVIHIGGESSRTVEQLGFSSAGKQLTLWRMRSQALYYRKNHGAMAAWASMQLECGWHIARKWLNRMRGGERAAPKVAESEALVELWRTAWRETRGGAVSPAQPW